MRDINQIIIHCSYTKPGQYVTASTIRHWHVEERGWSDIGYHYVITRDGELEQGRPIEKAGAHAKGHNSNSIGVCLVGGMKANGTPDCNYTRAQWDKLGSVVGMLQTVYSVGTVIGHRDLDSGKECPCFNVGAWWHEAV